MRGKMGGKALVRRRTDRRFLSAFSSCQPDIVRDDVGNVSHNWVGLAAPESG
jgi:hypothetical protein